MSQATRTNNYLFIDYTVAVTATDLPTKTRRCIRGAGGLSGLQPNPQSMPDTDDLKINYKFTNKNYDSLFTRLNQLLLSENAPKKVTFKEVNDCKTVLDVITLVQKKFA